MKKYIKKSLFVIFANATLVSDIYELSSFLYEPLEMRRA